MKMPNFAHYFKGTNFGTTDYESLVLEGLMKITCGYHNGYTLNGILLASGLVSRYYTNSQKLELTQLGEKVMYQLYDNLTKKLNVATAISLVQNQFDPDDDIPF